MNARELFTPTFTLIVVACFVACMLLDLGIIGSLFVCSALLAGASLQHIDGNKERIHAQIDALPAPRRRRARIALAVVVFALLGYAAWIEWSADNVREDLEERQSLIGGTPLYPEQTIDPFIVPAYPEQQPLAPLGD